MASNTIAGLLGEIQAEFERFNSMTLEANFLQARIDAEFEELDQISGRQDSIEIEIIQEHTRLLNQNTDATNRSNLSDDENNMMDEAGSASEGGPRALV